jgi:hypothetical protein
MEELGVTELWSVEPVEVKQRSSGDGMSSGLVLKNTLMLAGIAGINSQA